MLWLCPVCHFQLSCLSASSLYITARTVSNTCTTAWILFHLESSTIKQIALNCVSQSSLGMRMQPDSLLEYIMNGFENILERIPVPSLKSREFGLHGHLKSQLNSTYCILEFTFCQHDKKPINTVWLYFQSSPIPLPVFCIKLFLTDKGGFLFCFVFPQKIGKITVYSVSWWGRHLLTDPLVRKKSNEC